MGKSKKIPSTLIKSALRKLLILDSAHDLVDLRIPPSHHLESLRADRSSQWSIRINDQWRLCFAWDGTDAYEVEIVDYH